MKEATKQTLDELSDRKYRITAARTEIVSALAAHTSPITIQTLVNQVCADEASVYRTIALLVEEGLAEQVEVQDAATHYALASGHHHHLVCTNCDRIFHIPCTHPPIPERARTGGFRVTHHEVTFYGACTTCC